MDNFEWQHAVEEAEERVRCINCIYFLKPGAGLIAYGECRKSGDPKKPGDHCWEWSTVDLESHITKYKKGVSMSQESHIREILKYGLVEIKNIKVLDTGPIRISHEKDSGFPLFTIKYQGQTDTFNVYREIHPKAFLSIRSGAEALSFVEWLKIAAGNLKANRKTEYAKEISSRQERHIKEVIKSGLAGIKNIKASDTGPIRISHEKDSGFPLFTIKYQSQTDTFNVYMGIHPKAFLSIRIGAEAYLFVEWYKGTLELKANRK